MNTLPNSTAATSTGFVAVDYYLTVLKKYADFNGRARRSEYWYFVLVNFGISFTLGFIEGLLFESAGILSTLYTLAILVPYVAVCIRRMHDVGKSGWFALIPIYNFILAITEGTRSANEYGADPKK
ncbi:DUF805 domain-containing protein [Nibrella saemangeumensis]|uniref:DUF805 domain-containing protein n=1 Tax=Nibrella saemangeumensis TaxID=1084526 RepID=A0ABP8NP89_9BACT